MRTKHLFLIALLTASCATQNGGEEKVKDDKKKVEAPIKQKQSGEVKAPKPSIEDKEEVKAPIIQEQPGEAEEPFKPPKEDKKRSKKQKVQSKTSQSTTKTDKSQQPKAKQEDDFTNKTLELMRP